MDEASTERWNAWADSRIALALNRHVGELMQHLDKREQRIADVVAEEIVGQVKQLRAEIDQLRAQLTIVEVNANARVAPTRAKRHAAA